MFKALVSFSGVISMAEGDIGDIEPTLAKDLLRAGYIEEIKKPEKAETPKVETPKVVTTSKKTAKKKR